MKFFWWSNICIRMLAPWQHVLFSSIEMCLNYHMGYCFYQGWDSFVSSCVLFAVLSLYHTVPTFKDPWERGLLKKFLGKGENAGKQHFLLFPKCFLPFLKQNSNFELHLFCCLHMLLTGLKFCCLVGINSYFIGLNQYLWFSNHLAGSIYRRWDFYHDDKRIWSSHGIYFASREIWGRYGRYVCIVIIIIFISVAVLEENLRYCYSLGVIGIIVQKLCSITVIRKIFVWNSEYMFTIQRAIHTIKEDNSKCIVFLIMPLFWPRKLRHFVILLLLLKIFTWNRKYVFTIQRAIHTINGDNSKHIFFFFFFFSELCPFFNFLSSIKHPTAERWHLHEVLLFSQCFLSYLG